MSAGGDACVDRTLCPDSPIRPKQILGGLRTFLVLTNDGFAGEDFHEDSSRVAVNVI